MMKAAPLSVIFVEEVLLPQLSLANFSHHFVAGEISTGSSLRGLYYEHVLPGLMISATGDLCSRRWRSRPTDPWSPCVARGQSCRMGLCAQVPVNYLPKGGSCAAGAGGLPLKSLAATYLTALKRGPSGSVPTTTSSPTCRPPL